MSAITVSQLPLQPLSIIAQLTAAISSEYIQPSEKIEIKDLILSVKDQIKDPSKKTNISKAALQQLVQAAALQGSILLLEWTAPMLNLSSSNIYRLAHTYNNKDILTGGSLDTMIWLINRGFNPQDELISEAIAEHGTVVACNWALTKGICIPRRTYSYALLHFDAEKLAWLRAYVPKFDYETIAKLPLSTPAAIRWRNDLTNELQAKYEEALSKNDRKQLQELKEVDFFDNPKREAIYAKAQAGDDFEFFYWAHINLYALDSYPVAVRQGNTKLVNQLAEDGFIPKSHGFETCIAEGRLPTVEWFLETKQFKVDQSHIVLAMVKGQAEMAVYLTSMLNQE